VEVLVLGERQAQAGEAERPRRGDAAVGDEDDGPGDPPKDSAPSSIQSSKNPPSGKNALPGHDLARTTKQQF